ncbi:hypothetical protein [Streptomyces sp. NPDC002540]
MSSSIVLMSDPRVAAIPLQDCGERLVDVREHGLQVDDRRQDATGAYAHVRQGVLTRAQTNRATLKAVLSAARLTNYSIEFWHRSFGDRYWALQTKQPAALYGPVELP